MRGKSSGICRFRRRSPVIQLGKYERCPTASRLMTEYRQLVSGGAADDTFTAGKLDWSACVIFFWDDPKSEDNFVGILLGVYGFLLPHHS
ncbi:uncharacterized protein EI90DRAFT_3056054 [Cantharellus anzutake]|uniref:uncharacterized protein n=1 Tax=Cantharellus anzutake TaxID=1750568 RepID=UPI001908454D|nr:uncharacterized protein EI90DRAFT_3056054 [Cantharellus anzutake]KAF8331963.1 hypothetical protein EI90DRAFT_3056054 [Cantharellus anzutake]